MELDKKLISKVIRSLIAGEDSRRVTLDIINSKFMKFMLDFFKEVVDAKMQSKDINVDWYKKALLNENLSPEDILINAGLNKKTIFNIYGSTNKEMVLDASAKNHAKLKQDIQDLVDKEADLNLNLSIKMGQVSVELNITESLMVMNTIAVKRASIRGGAWSKVGKNVEKPLMISLCMLHNVPKENYAINLKGTNIGNDDKENFSREIDFYLLSGKEEYKCEVKLMGKGNPESADAVIARDSSLFVADKLSPLNKNQLDSRKVHWVELQSGQAVQQFGDVLTELNIPHKKPKNIDLELDKILNKILS